MSGTLSAKDSEHVPAFMELVVSWDRVQLHKEKDLIVRIINTYKRYKKKELTEIKIVGICIVHYCIHWFLHILFDITILLSIDSEETFFNLLISVTSNFDPRVLIIHSA